MIHLTETFAVALRQHPINPNRTYLNTGLSEYLESRGGWEKLFEEFAGDSENEEKLTLVLPLPDLIEAVSVFSRSVFPKSDRAHLLRFVVSLLDQHLALSLFNRHEIVTERLDVSAIQFRDPIQYPSLMRLNLSFEFLLAHYLTTGELTVGLKARVKDLAFENFLVLVTSPFFSVVESHLEPVLTEISDINDPILEIFRDTDIPLLYGNGVDPVEIGEKVIRKYPKEYLQELARKTLSGRASRCFLDRAREFIPTVMGQRYDQISNSDWVDFIESDLGLRYTVFEASTRIGGERFAQKLSKLTVFALMTRTLPLCF